MPRTRQPTAHINISNPNVITATPHHVHAANIDAYALPGYADSAARQLQFHSNNETYRHVLDALAIVKQYAGSRLDTYPAEIKVPMDGIIRGPWQETMTKRDAQGATGINQLAYEICGVSAATDLFRGLMKWEAKAKAIGDPQAHFHGRKAK